MTSIILIISFVVTAFGLGVAAWSLYSTRKNIHSSNNNRRNTYYSSGTLMFEGGTLNFPKNQSITIEEKTRVRDLLINKAEDLLSLSLNKDEKFKYIAATLSMYLEQLAKQVED